MQNLQSKTPYKFKKSYGGTPEPQTPQDAPWLRGPSLKTKKNLNPELLLWPWVTEPSNIQLYLFLSSVPANGSKHRTRKYNTGIRYKESQSFKIY